MTSYLHNAYGHYKDLGAVDVSSEWVKKDEKYFNALSLWGINILKYLKICGEHIFFLTTHVWLISTPNSISVIEFIVFSRKILNLIGRAM